MLPILSLARILAAAGHSLAFSLPASEACRQQKQLLPRLIQCMAQLGRPQGSANCSLGRSPKNMSTGQNSINTLAAHGTQQGFMYISYCSTGQTWLLLQTDNLCAAVVVAVQDWWGLLIPMPPLQQGAALLPSCRNSCPASKEGSMHTW